MANFIIGLVIGFVAGIVAGVFLLAIVRYNRLEE